MLQYYLSLMEGKNTLHNPTHGTHRPVAIWLTNQTRRRNQLRNGIKAFLTSRTNIFDGRTDAQLQCEMAGEGIWGGGGIKSYAKKKVISIFRPFSGMWKISGFLLAQFLRPLSAQQYACFKILKCDTAGMGNFPWMFSDFSQWIKVLSLPRRTKSFSAFSMLSS